MQHLFCLQRRRTLRWLLGGAGGFALYGCGGGGDPDNEMSEVALATAAAPAASLLAKSIRGALKGPPFSRPVLLDKSATVGTAIEFRYDDVGGSYWTADFGDSTLTLAVFLGNTTNAGLSGMQRSWSFTLPGDLTFITDQGFPRAISNTFPIGPDFGDSDGHGFYFLMRPFEAAPNSVFTATWDLDIRLIC